ncbi:Type II secretory pathway prepilin signal peptidase [Methylocystis sp. SC2]|nr:Type II secretory pathway prepilin signal peptidase [Methylocystis sp. SC2]
MSVGRLFGPSCRRRRRALGPVARGILLGRSDSRPLTMTAWLSLLALAALLGQRDELGWLLLPSLLLFMALCMIALFDARYFVIPDGPLLFLVLCGLVTIVAIAPEAIGARIAAAALGFIALQLVSLAYQTLRGAAGVGEGDARLFAVAGLWLGSEGLPSCLVYATISALLSAVISLRQGTLENARAPMPFAPHLALGLWVVWVVGPIEFG